MRFVHGLAADVGGYPPAVHNGGTQAARRSHGQLADRPVAGSSEVTWPPKPVSTSRPPISSAAVTTSEWATRQATDPSGSMANVSISAWTTTCARRGDPSRARIGVADR